MTPPPYKDPRILEDKQVEVKLFVPEDPTRINESTGAGGGVKFQSEPIKIVYKPVQQQTSIRSDISPKLNRLTCLYINDHDDSIHDTTSKREREREDNNSFL